MVSHADAVKAFVELDNFIASCVVGLRNADADPMVAPEGMDARQSLIASGELMTSDAQKFTLMFMDSAPPPEDCVGLCSRVRQTVDKFAAWCTATGGSSPAMRRGVADLAEEVLLAMQRLVKQVLALNLKSEPEPLFVGAVMAAAEEMKKKLPASQASAVQKQLLKDAAAVKSVITDVEEMIQDNTDPNKIADSLDDMGMDKEHSERDDFDDMMDMNVTLSREELITAQAALQLSKDAMSILKVAVRVLMKGTPEGMSYDLEDLSKASSVFTRAAEDLGANCVFEPAQCRGDAEALVQGLTEACQALQAICGGAVPEDAAAALDRARQQLARME